MSKHYYIIKVLDQSGNWYNNAYIENGFDAAAVAKFYRDTLKYKVQLWHAEQDVSFLLESEGAVLII